MNYEEILKDFIEDKIESAWYNKRNALNLRGQAFGALMFAQEASLIPYEILHEMWEGENGYHAQFPIK